MRVLILHNRYRIPGGEDVVVQAEKDLLESKGHCVALLEVNNDDITSIAAKVKVGINTIYSYHSKQLVLEKITSFQPEIVHIHNFFPVLSPSIYYACYENDIPVVQTLHNYRLFCANYSFFRDGKVCEDCLGKLFPWPGIVHRCYHNSLTGTTMVATMQFLHKILLTWSKRIDTYITLTEFSRQKFIQGNLPKSKLVVKPNFLHIDPGPGKGNGNYALFVGRLSLEKGLDTMLKAWESLGKKIPLKILGDGPLAQQVVYAEKQIPGVEWLGYQSKEKVFELMGEALVLIFPSQWYETFGLVVIEAFAKGTPLIAANIGAITELIDQERTGLLFRPGDSEDLQAKVEWMLNHPEKVTNMRREARAEFEAKYTAEQNYKSLMAIYEGVLNG